MWPFTCKVCRHIHEILVGMFTDINGDTDPFRVWGTFGLLTLIGFTGWTIAKAGTFDPVNYGAALATYFAAWGAAVFAKAKGDGRSE